MRRGIRRYLRHLLATAAIIALGLVVGAVILGEQGLRFPLLEEDPQRIEVELADAHAVQPGQGQTVRVAGVRIGDIGDVRLEDGKAVVELLIDPEFKGLVRADATALLRAKTGLKDMFVEVDPGDGPPLGEGNRIRLSNTAPDVDQDEILATFDRDTRDYFRLLISAGGKGVRGRGADLRATLRVLRPLHRDVARVGRAIARRRHNLRRLVHRYGLLVDELGRNGGELTRLVRTSEAALGAVAAEDEHVSASVAALPAALRETQTALAKVDRLGRSLVPALDALRPPVRRLPAANRALAPLLREATPIVRGELRPFARAARPFVDELGDAAGDLTRAGPDVEGTFHGLNRLLNIGAFNPNGAERLSGDLQRDRDRQEGFLYWFAWTAQNTVSLFNTSDAHGPLRRIFFGGITCQVLKGPLDAQVAGVPEPLHTQLGDALAGAFEALASAGVCAAAQGGGAP